MTNEELLSLPVSVDIETAARALGISKAHAYELIQEDAFPLAIIRLGRRIVVPRAVLLGALHVEGPYNGQAKAVA